MYSILVELGVGNNSITEIIYKWSNNDLQNTTLKAKDRVTRTSLKSGGELGFPEGCAIPSPHMAPCQPTRIQDGHTVGPRYL